MSDIKIRSFEDDDDDDGARGKRGKRGHRGEQGLAGAAFTPARTLFVAESWPAGADPTIFFTSIAAAYAASAALNPTAADPVEILVYPGTYPDPITIVSNVHLIGTGQQRAVNVTGAVTWTLGAGINAPQTNADENLNVCFITFLAPWLIDSTAKAGGSSAGPVFRGVILSGLIYNGQSGLDTSIIFASVLMPGTYTFNNIAAMNLYATRGRAMSFTGSTSFQIAGGTELGLITLSGTASGRITGIADLGGVSVGAGCSVVLSGCDNTGAITVAAGGSADVRATNYGGNANLVGPGTINRTTFATSFGPTAIGANAVVFAVPYPDGTYNVNLQLVAGAGSAAVTVTAKTGTGFTINDPVGGNTFDFVVSHD
jgi:hypothetical protein